MGLRFSACGPPVFPFVTPHDQGHFHAAVFRCVTLIPKGTAAGWHQVIPSGGS